MQSLLRYNEKHRSATWLELFFDLVFVAAIGFITHDLAHTHDKHLSIQQLIAFPLQFIPIWWIWASHTIYSNRFDTDSKHHRLATLFIMLLLVFIPTFIGKNIQQHYIYFVICYVLIRFIIAAMYFQSAEKYGAASQQARTIALSFFIGALICLSSVFFDGVVSYLIFYTGIAFDLLYPLITKDKFKKIPIDLPHLIERAGLLVIILQGEALISLVASLQNVSWNFFSLAAALSGFVMTGAIWWIYFDSYHNLGRAKRTLTGHTILYAHLIVCLGFILLANIIRHAILQDLSKDYFSVLAITGMLLFYIGKQIPYYVLFPPFRLNIVINTVVCIGITIFSVFLPRTEYALIGMTLAMLFYTYANLKWTISKDVSEYLNS